MPKLIIKGEVTVKPCESVSRDHVWGILILGPTGAGKSSFIEAVAGEGQTLGISKDQLAGFTQQVTAYEVTNVAVLEKDLIPYTLYLIDAPGFSDSKISELEIITKVKQWLTDQSVYQIYGVLYLSSITDTRVSGSKRRTIKMIQSLLCDKAFDCASIVTTMWDRVSNPRAKKRAEANFAQLRDNIWKGPIRRGANISRFYNNHNSAMQIMQDHINSVKGDYVPLMHDKIGPGDRPAPFLYQELLDRINNARQEKELLRQDKIQLISEPDPQLESVVLSRLPEVEDDLLKFIGQLVEFGTPPPGFDVIPEHFAYEDLLDNVREAREEQAALMQALAHLYTNPDGIREATLIRQLDLVQQDLEQRVTTLLDGGTAPKGYEDALEHALESLITWDQVLALWSPPSWNDPVPNLPNPTADSEIVPTDSIPDGCGVLVHAAPHPTSTVPMLSGNTSPRRIASAENSEGGISSQTFFKGRMKIAFQLFRDKIQSRSRQEGRR